MNGEKRMTDKQIIKTLHSIKTHCKEMICNQCRFHVFDTYGGACQIRTLINKMSSKFPYEWDMERVKEIIEQ